jgi:hypothetical protein
MLSPDKEPEREIIYTPIMPFGEAGIKRGVAAMAVGFPMTEQLGRR